MDYNITVNYVNLLKIKHSHEINKQINANII